MLIGSHFCFREQTNLEILYTLSVKRRKTNFGEDVGGCILFGEKRRSPTRGESWLCNPLFGEKLIVVEILKKRPPGSGHRGISKPS